MLDDIEIYLGFFFDAKEVRVRHVKKALEVKEHTMWLQDQIYYATEGKRRALEMLKTNYSLF